MSAIDNKHMLEIVSIIPQPFTSKSTGKPGVLYKAQCQFHGSDQGIMVGQLILAPSLKDTVPGKYLAEFELGVNFKLEVIPKITALHPFAGTAPIAKPLAQPAAATAAATAAKAS